MPPRSIQMWKYATGVLKRLSRVQPDERVQVEDVPEDLWVEDECVFTRVKIRRGGDYREPFLRLQEKIKARTNRLYM